jgi:hypothetical protein
MNLIKRAAAGRRWVPGAVCWGLALFGAAAFAAEPGAAGGPRLRLERLSESPWPATVGTVAFWPAPPAGPRFTVLTGEGQAVGALVLSAEPGEATRLAFDTTGGAGEYWISFAAEAPRGPATWRPRAGVTVETRSCRKQPIDTLEQVGRLLASPERIQGRSYQPNIFLGVNPHGPSLYYAAIFEGWFKVDQAGRYAFATDSDDASYLSIDNRVVATWLGSHGAAGGRRGEHQGAIDLKAGVHQIGYVQVQFEDQSAAVAAWKPPGADRFEVMQPGAFLPVARFRVRDVATAGTGPQPLYFEWSAVDHCALADAVVARAVFRVPGASARSTVRWQFDDGESATGPTVRHWFARPGHREVRVQAIEQGRTVATNSVRVKVEPNWLQLENWSDDLAATVRQELARRDLTRLPAADLSELVEWADRAAEPGLLKRLGETLIARADEFVSAPAASLFYRLGLALQGQGDAGDQAAERALRLALAPGRESASLAAHLRLRLAELSLELGGSAEETERLLGRAPSPAFTPDERRGWQILRGDVARARGQTDRARELYAGLGTNTAEGKLRSDVFRSAQLEAASLALRQGNPEGAQATLDRLLLGQPLARLDRPVALLRGQIQIARKQFRRAFTQARWALAGEDRDPRRADLLEVLATAALELGETNAARGALTELTQTFPFSAAAARAKDRWQHHPPGPPR